MDGDMIMIYDGTEWKRGGPIANHCGLFGFL